MSNMCWVELEVTPTNIEYSSNISFRGKHWNININKDKVRLTSETPHTESDFSDNSHRDICGINQIIGHTRNIICFVFGIDVKWGYKSCAVLYQSDFFPSIHQQSSTEHSSKTFDKGSLPTLYSFFNTISKSRKRGISTLLNYWRRAFELDQLGYDAEAFLNYFKVLECISEIGKGGPRHKQLLKRFTVTVSGKKDKEPMPSLKQYSFNQVYLATAILAGAGYDSKVRRSNLLYVLKVICIRNNWNVGHKIFRNNPYDTYDAIGQHSIEFSHVMIENIYIEEISKYYILRYLRPGKYMLDNSYGVPSVALLKK